jgi:hypothetical protein
MKRLLGWILYLFGAACLLVMAIETLNRPDRFTIKAIEFFSGGVCFALLFLVPGILLIVWARREKWKRAQKSHKEQTRDEKEPPRE